MPQVPHNLRGLERRSDKPPVESPILDFLEASEVKEIGACRSRYARDTCQPCSTIELPPPRSSASLKKDGHAQDRRPLAELVD